MTTAAIPPGRVTWQRVWRHPDALIQPLDARTVYQADAARLRVGGEITANLQRRNGLWELRLQGQPELLASSGRTALEAVSNWLLHSKEDPA